MIKHGGPELLEYADSRRFSVEPDVVKSNRDVDSSKGSSQNLVGSSTTRIVCRYMTLFLLLTMKELDIAMDF